MPKNVESVNTIIKEKKINSHRDEIRSLAVKNFSS